MNLDCQQHIFEHTFLLIFVIHIFVWGATRRPRRFEIVRLIASASLSFCNDYMIRKTCLIFFLNVFIVQTQPQHRPSYQGFVLCARICNLYLTAMREWFIKQRLILRFIFVYPNWYFGKMPVMCSFYFSLPLAWRCFSIKSRWFQRHLIL